MGRVSGGDVAYWLLVAASVAFAVFFVVFNDDATGPWGFHYHNPFQNLGGAP